MNHVILNPKYRYVYTEDGLSVWWEWCCEMFGPPTNSQYGAPISEQYWGWELDGRVWFCNPEHATLFALRWS